MSLTATGQMHDTIRNHIGKTVTVTDNRRLTHTGKLQNATAIDSDDDTFGLITKITLNFKNKLNPVEFTIYHNEENPLTLTFTN